MKRITLFLVLALLTLPLSGCSLFKKKSPEQTPTTKKIERPVNQIPVSQRPYVELVPLSGRNKLNLIIHDRKKKADNVEVILEYDRNEGVMDAVLKQFPLTKNPQIEELFLGSKSAGGHITYHDDVIGGTLKLAFDGDEPYTLEVPWRYDDKQNDYNQLSTADGKFQLVLSQPLKTSKVIIMQSPGFPGELKEDVLAGPYLVRIVGELPDSQANLSIRISEEGATPKLLGWDGQDWQEIESKVESKTLTATTSLYEVFVVAQK